ncbi:hypothetical protein ASPCAL02992 [Aspergillus calidoustus]|uniref:Uncharacterized protein n=1 Tax=Aspergillus calidoustus TaxID=454130 RepID=A0A0U5HGM2_ASPCI|nr:hypothetical protein ASPCAL02992 [Aspergillus calidoustus]
MNTTTITPTRGWVEEPRGRGSWSILSTCLLTISLCCWASVCPNIPAKSEGTWARLRDKIHLALLAILGPEFLLMVAMGQWSSARRSVKGFRKLYETKRLANNDWTMTHAFYADMGGFLLDGPGIDAPFPIDAKQLLFLVEQGYLVYPRISREDIGDRDKSDRVTRVFTVCQGVWMMLNCILRATQGLALTTLELTTISFVIVFVATSFCWYHKPSDVTTTRTLSLSTHIDLIRAVHCPRDQVEWYTNPLDFLQPKFYMLQMFWIYYNQLLARLHCPIFSRRVTTRPYNRIPSDEFRQAGLLGEAIAFPFIVAFGGVFAFGWRFHFPSEAERILWRIAASYTLGYSILGCFCMKLCDDIILPRYIKRRARRTTRARDAEAQETSFSRLVSRVRYLDPSKDPRLEIPLEALFLISSLCIVYCVCRAYILAEDFVGLRELPASAFRTVAWSIYVPHW